MEYILTIKSLPTSGSIQALVLLAVFAAVASATVGYQRSSYYAYPYQPAYGYNYGPNYQYGAGYRVGGFSVQAGVAPGYHGYQPYYGPSYAYGPAYYPYRA